MPSKHFVGDGEIADIVIDETPDTVIAYVAEKPSNAPLEGATVGLLGEGTDVALPLAYTGEAGKYVLKGEAADKFRNLTTKPDFALQAIIEKGEANDIIPVALEEQPKEVMAPLAESMAPSSQPIGLFLALALIAGCLVGAAGLYVALRRRIQRRAFSLLALCGPCVLAANTLLPALLWAHEGHEHAPDPGAGASAAVSGGVIRLPKPAQFLLGVRSITAEKRPLRDSVIGYGHLHPKPQFDAVITAPQSGFIRASDGLALGAKVRKGQTLAYLDALARIALVSPVDGDIQEMEVVSGSRVEAGSKLFRVSDTKLLWVDAEIYEADILRIPDGAKVEVVIDGTETPISGMLMTSRSPISEETRTAKFFVEIGNEDGKLRLGALASVYFILPGSRVGISLPKAAVLNRGGEQVVIIQTGPETFKAQAVIAERSSEPDETHILSGLVGDERVVVAGNYQLLAKAK